MTKIGIVCGMVSEVRTLGKLAQDSRVMTAVSAADPNRAAAEGARLIEEGCSILVSWGLAGGLDPSLVPGQVVEPGTVVLPDGRRLELEAGPRSKTALLGVDFVVTDPAEKSRLWSDSKAVAIDMESHRLAIVAREAGVPLHVIRAISDPADRALPLLAATALGPDGRPKIGRVIMGLLRHPMELPGLIAAGRDSSRALKALSREAVRRIPRLLVEQPGDELSPG